MDREAPAEVALRIAAVVAEFPEIHGFHDLKTRVSGSRTFVQLHIELDPDLPLFDAHAVPESEVLVHLDPVGDGGTPR